MEKAKRGAPAQSPAYIPANSQNTNTRRADEPSRETPPSALQASGQGKRLSFAPLEVLTHRTPSFPRGSDARAGEERRSVRTSGGWAGVAPFFTGAFEDGHDCNVLADGQNRKRET